MISGIILKGTPVSDIATLGISVDGSEVRTATKEINALKEVSGRAEKAAGALARAFQSLNSNAQVANGITVTVH